MSIQEGGNAMEIDTAFCSHLAIHCKNSKSGTVNEGGNTCAWPLIKMEIGNEKLRFIKKSTFIRINTFLFT